jgi:hypothetical protein
MHVQDVALPLVGSQQRLTLRIRAGTREAWGVGLGQQTPAKESLLDTARDPG